MKPLLILYIFLLISAPIWAQPGFDDTVQDTPIDGGVSLLVGAGVAYGVTKIRKEKKKLNNEV